MAGLYSSGNQARNQAYNMTLGGSAEDVQNRLNAAYYGNNGSTRTYNGSAGAGGGGYSGGGTVAYGSGGGGGGYGYGSSLGAQYQQQFDQARAANESRYNQLLTEQNSLRDRVMADVNQGNSQAVTDLNRNFDRQRSSGSQDMISRGLTGSTINQTMNQGIERNRGESLNRQAADFRRERLGYDTALTGQRLATIENRTDSYPEMQQLMALAQLNGQGGMGGGGGAGVYGGMGDGGYGSAAGTPYAGLQSALGNVFGGFAGNSMHQGIANTSARQGANTQRAYANGGAMSGGSFNGGYSDPYRGMQNNVVGQNYQVLGNTPYYGNYA